MTPVPPLVFTETQLFRHQWRWLLVGLTLLLLGLPTLTLYRKFDWLALLLLAVTLVPIQAGLWLLRLETRLDATGIHYRYWPMIWYWRHWPWTELARVFPRTYNPLADYGGWGIKGLPGDLLYNVAGRHGLQLLFVSRNRLLLGTQRPAELRATLAALRAAYPTLPIRLPAIETAGR